MDLAADVVAFIEKLFTHAHVASMALGIAVAVGVTQWAKFPLRRIADCRGWSLNTFRFLTRTTAASVGAVATFLTWPQPGKFAVLWSLAVGFCVPLVYTGSVRFIARFWPWLGDRVSSDRVPPESDNETGVL